MNADEWRERVALMLPYLEHREPLVAEIAYGQLKAEPYAALLAVKSRIAAPGGSGAGLASRSLRRGNRSICCYWRAPGGEGRRKTRIADRRRVAGGRRDRSTRWHAHRGRSAAAWTGARWHGSTSITSAIASAQHREIEAVLLALERARQREYGDCPGRASSSRTACSSKSTRTSQDTSRRTSRRGNVGMQPTEYVAILKSDLRQQYPSPPRHRRLPAAESGRRASRPAAGHRTFGDAPLGERDTVPVMPQ